MIGAPLSSSASLFSATSLGSLTPRGAPAAPIAGRASGTGWLDGLGAGGGAVSLRADVPADQRGLSVEQHAERVLAALIG
jgi:hypothetical protein